MQLNYPAAVVGVIVNNPKMLKEHIEEGLDHIEKMRVTPSLNIMNFYDDDSETVEDLSRRS